MSKKTVIKSSTNGIKDDYVIDIISKIYGQLMLKKKKQNVKKERGISNQQMLRGKNNFDNILKITQEHDRHRKVIGQSDLLTKNVKLHSYMFSTSKTIFCKIFVLNNQI